MKIPLASESFYFISPSFLLGMTFLFFKIWPLSVIFFLLTLFLLFFFRDPERKISARPGSLLSPADGKIVDIEKGESCQKISIFLSLLDVHIVRSPSEGRIGSIERKKGKKLPAFKSEASRLNQSMTLTIRNQQEKIELKMITGLAARRLRCFVRIGDRVTAGMKLGLIAFGSRVEISFPVDYFLKVELNQKVKGGLTILAEKEMAAA